MSEIREMFYVGPLQHLYGEQALVKQCDDFEGAVMAQFNSQWLTRSGAPIPEQYKTGDFSLACLPEMPLGLNWHRFSSACFEPLPPGKKA